MKASILILMQFDYKKENKNTPFYNCLDAWDLKQFVYKSKTVNIWRIDFNGRIISNKL